MNIAQRNREATTSQNSWTVEYWLEEIGVSPSEGEDPMQYPKGWFVVTDLFGVVAAFSTKEEASNYERPRLRGAFL